MSIPSRSIKCKNYSNNSPNTTLRVPKYSFSIMAYKKTHKYVMCSEKLSAANAERNNHGVLNNLAAMFRPITPPGMYRKVEKRPIKILSLTLYKKKRTFVSL